MSCWYKDVQKKENTSKKLFRINDVVSSITAIDSNNILVTLHNGAVVHKIKNKKREFRCEGKLFASTYFNSRYYVAGEQGIFELSNELTEVIKRAANCVAITHTDDALVTGWDDGCVVVYDINNIEILTLGVAEVIDIHCNSTTAAIATRSGIEIYDICQSKNLTHYYFTEGMKNITGTPTSIQISNNGLKVLVGTADGRCTVLIKEALKYSFFAHCNKEANTSADVTSSLFFNNQFAVTTATDGDINLWNVELRNIVGSLTIGSNEITTAIIVQDFLIFSAKATSSNKGMVYQVHLKPLFCRDLLNKECNETTIDICSTTPITTTKTKHTVQNDKTQNVTTKRTSGKKDKTNVHSHYENISNISLFTNSYEELSRKSVGITKGRTGHCVMLTGYDVLNEKIEKKQIEIFGLFSCTPFIDKCDVVICYENRRTIDVLIAIVHGIPIVTPNWLSQSHILNKVLPYDKYKPIEVFPALKTTFDNTFLQGITIGIIGETKLRESVIKKLISLTGAQFIDRVKNANYVLVGAMEVKIDATRRTEGFAVEERWLYDCISNSKRIKETDYLIEGELYNKRRDRSISSETLVRSRSKRRRNPLQALGNIVEITSK
ncbi:BRCT domain-containing protein [Entamoeba marina]